jgi:hypothetical protein
MPTTPTVPFFTKMDPLKLNAKQIAGARRRRANLAAKKIIAASGVRGSGGAADSTVTVTPVHVQRRSVADLPVEPAPRYMSPTEVEAARLTMQAAAESRRLKEEIRLIIAMEKKQGTEGSDRAYIARLDRKLTPKRFDVHKALLEAARAFRPPKRIPSMPVARPLVARPLSATRFSTTGYTPSRYAARAKAAESSAVTVPGLH